MGDQADKLRKIVKNLGSPANTGVQSQKKSVAKVITVTSGKGGVGKTNITVNLAIVLSQMGFKVAILDVDFGFANVDVMLGVTAKYTLLELIRGERNIFEVLNDGPYNIQFLSGGSGVEELIQLDKEHIGEFISNISLLDNIFDVILIDTGAGLSKNIMSFILAADEVLLVTTPEPTAITDAYAMIKMISKKDKHRIVKLVVNKAESYKEANEILDKLLMVSDKFLSFKLQKTGYILKDECIPKAVKQQKPFCISYPKSQASHQITELAMNLFCINNEGNNNTNIYGKGIKGFFSRLLSSYGLQH